LKHERLTPTERMLETLLLMRIRVVPTIEARAQFRIAEHFVRLVDACHLLLSIFFCETLLGRLVGVMLLGQFSVGRLNLSLVGVTRNVENLIVVLGLTPLQSDFSVAQKLVCQATFAFGRGFLGLLEAMDSGVEFFRVKLSLALVKKGVKGILIERE